MAAALIACRQANVASLRSPNQGHQAVAEILVRPAAGVEHGLRDRGKKAVDHEYGVERQLLIRPAHRASHVDEHADDIALLREMNPAPAEGKGLVGLWRQHGDEGDILLRPQLAGEPHCRIGARAHALQNIGFARRWPRQPAAVANDANPAGRAAPLAAADAGMGNAISQARLEYGQPARHPDRAIRVAQSHEPATALAQAAKPARGEHKTDGSRIAQEKIVANRQERCPLRRGAQASRRPHFCNPLRIFRELLDSFSLLIKSEKCKERQQNGGEKQVRRRTRKPWPQSQPQPQSDAGMCPGHDDKNHLNRGEVRAHHPERVQRLAIALLQAV